MIHNEKSIVLALTISHSSLSQGVQYFIRSQYTCLRRGDSQVITGRLKNVFKTSFVCYGCLKDVLVSRPVFTGKKNSQIWWLFPFNCFESYINSANSSLVAQLKIYSLSFSVNSYHYKTNKTCNKHWTLHTKLAVPEKSNPFCKKYKTNFNTERRKSNIMFWFVLILNLNCLLGSCFLFAKRKLLRLWTSGIWLKPTLPSVNLNTAQLKVRSDRHRQ